MPRPLAGISRPGATVVGRAGSGPCATVFGRPGLHIALHIARPGVVSVHRILFRCDGLWLARVGVFVHTPTWIDPAGMESSLADCPEIASGGNSDGESLADAWGGNSDGENLDADSDVGDVLLGLWGESPGDVDDSLCEMNTPGMCPRLVSEMNTGRQLIRCCTSSSMT